MGRPLDKIRIKGFKSIRELDLDLKSLNVLIGANGSGKSNFISAFKLLNRLIEEKLQTFVAKSGGASSLLYFGSKMTTELSIELNFRPNGYQCVLAPAQDETLFFTDEICWFQGEKYAQPLKEHLGAGHKETKIHETRKRTGRVTIEDYVASSVSDWRIYHFHDTGETALMKGLVDIDNNQVFNPDASNLPAFLYLLKKKYLDNYKNIVDSIRLVAPFFDDFVLQPSRLNPKKIQLEWHQKDSESYFNAHSLSDGTIRFICLATLLLQPRLPSTILLDEPELGLHPYAITVLANLLQSISKKTQIIASTQSVTLVNQLQPEEVIVVDWLENQSSFKRLGYAEIVTWLDEYGLGDLWEKNIIGGRPKV